MQGGILLLLLCMFIPLVDDTIEIEVNPGDIEWAFFRSGGSWWTERK